MGRGNVRWLAVALLAAACLDKQHQPPCDPAVDTSCPVVTQAVCTRDSDCGDGTCQPDGTCKPPATAPVPSACANVTCPADHFCSNGQCILASPQCAQPDPACIYIPQGAFEPPVHEWWWPWLTPSGPEDTTGKDRYISGLEYPDYTQVMSTPVVMRLHASDASPAVVFNTFSPDPNNFGTVESQGVLRAISGADGSPLWTAPKDMWNNMQYSTDGNAGVAAGDCLGTGEPCFITGGWDPQDVNVCNGNTGTCSLSGKSCSASLPCDTSISHQHGGLIAFGRDGRVLWVTRDARVWWGAPAIARLLGPTGPAQVVVGNGVYDGKTGKTLCPQTTSPLDQVGGNGDGTLSAVADIDLDGVPEIITGNQAYKLLPDSSSATGYTCKAMFGPGVRIPNQPPNCPYGQTTSVETGKQVCLCPGGYEDVCPDGFPALASFSGYGASMGLSTSDPHAQIVVVSHGYLRIQDWTGGMLLNPIPLPGDASRCPNGEFNAGGAPTIADFDGDGLPEIGVASQGAYSVWKPGKGFIWQEPTFDCSASTGSSVFDFEGKGKATAVYSDQCYFRVYDGATGTPLIQEPNSDCTAYEMPIVADVDGSGRAKILVPNNNICNYQCNWPGGTVGQLQSRYVGLKALMSPSDKWVNTRSVWNEHTYHIGNVNLDGTLPYPEPDSWAAGQFNSYRQNKQGQGQFSAPDLSACEVTVDMTRCATTGATSSAVVYNGGALMAKAGVSVDFYVVMGGGSTAHIGTAYTTRALQPGDSEKVSVNWVAPPQNQSVTVRAVIDQNGLIGDCHPANNAASTAAPVKCSPLG